jgi:predicted nucleic acid-binding protein
VAKDKRVKKELADHKKVALDTSVFIHHFEGAEKSDLTSQVLQRVQDGQCTGIVSTITLAEVLIRPMERGLDSLVDLYRMFFHEMPNLQMVAVDMEVASRAAILRAEQGLKMADCIVLATALEAGATALVTVKPGPGTVEGLQVMTLDEYLNE